MGYNDPAAQGILGLMSALVLRLLRSLQSLDSFGGTRADINPNAHLDSHELVTIKSRQMFVGLCGTL